MYEIGKSVIHLKREILAARVRIDGERQKLANEEIVCAELEKLLEPLNVLNFEQPKHSPTEAVREKMRASQRARWEKRKAEHSAGSGTVDKVA